MGYQYGIRKIEVLVEPQNVPGMLLALAECAKANMKSHSQWKISQNREALDSNSRPISDCYRNNRIREIEKHEEIIQSLASRELCREEILNNLEWSYYFDEDGALTSMYHCDQSRDLNEEELEAIAPFVKDGSFIEACGDDYDDIFRYIFRNGEMDRVNAVISFPEQ